MISCQLLAHKLLWPDRKWLSAAHIYSWPVQNRAQAFPLLQLQVPNMQTNNGSFLPHKNLNHRLLVIV